MSKTKSIKFNAIMNFILTMSNFIFPLITFPYISHTLLAEGNGKISFAASFVSYFSMFAMLGIPTYGIRVCAKVREDKEKLSRTVQELLIINSITTVVSFIALIICINMINKLETQKTLILINSISMLLNVLGVNWLYSALEQYSYITIRSLIFKIFSIVLMFIFVKSPNDYIIYGAILVFATGGANLLNFYNLRKYVTLKPIGNYKFTLHIKPILIFFATSVAHSIYTNLDIIMLGFITDNQTVGWYSAAIRINRILLSLVTALSIVMLPRLSNYIENKKINEFNELIKKTVNFVIIVSLPIVIYFIVYANESILFISGESFLGAVKPMQILMPIIFIAGIASITGTQILIPIGKEKIFLISVIAGAVVDLILNMVLTVYLGAEGTAIATLLAEFTVLIVQIISIKDILIKAIKRINYRAIIIANAISIGIIIILKIKIQLTILLTLILTSSIYFSSYIFILLMLKEEFTTNCISIIINKFRIILNNNVWRKRY